MSPEGTRAPAGATVCFTMHGIGVSTGIAIGHAHLFAGMSAEVMQSALLPFFTTKPQGGGLGLALCREIVDAHGGRLSLHPRQGGGIAVRCWLPHEG